MRTTAIQQGEKYIYEESNNFDSPCKHGVVIKTYKLDIKEMININNIKLICVLIMIFQKKSTESKQKNQTLLYERKENIRQGRKEKYRLLNIQWIKGRWPGI